MPAHQMEAPSPRAHHLRQSKKVFDVSFSAPQEVPRLPPPRQLSPSPSRGRTNPLARALASRRRDRCKASGDMMLELSPSRRRLLEEEESEENIREAGKTENDASQSREAAAAFSPFTPIETTSQFNQRGIDSINAVPAPTENHQREQAAVSLFASQTMSIGNREKNMDGISSKYLPSPRETAATVRATTLTARATTQTPEGPRATMHDPIATTQTAAATTALNDPRAMTQTQAAAAAAATEMNDPRATTQRPAGETSTTNDPSATTQRPAAETAMNDPRAMTQTPAGGTSMTNDPSATTQRPAAAETAMNDARAMTQTPAGGTSTTNDPSVTTQRPAGAGEATSATRPTTPVEVTTRFKTFSSLGIQNMCHKFVPSQSRCSDATIKAGMDSRSDASSNVLESLTLRGSLETAQSLTQQRAGGLGPSKEVGAQLYKHESTGGSSKASSSSWAGNQAPIVGGEHVEQESSVSKNARFPPAQHTGGGAQNLRLPPGAVEKLRSAQSISHNTNLMSPRSAGGGIPGSSPRVPAASPSSSPRRRNNGRPFTLHTLASRHPAHSQSVSSDITTTTRTTRTMVGPSPRAQAYAQAQGAATLIDGTPLITPLPPLRASYIDGPSLRYNATLSIGMQKARYLKLLESQFTEGLRALKEQFEFHVRAINDQRDRQERHYFLQIDKEIDRLVKKLQRDYEVEIMKRKHDHEELIQQNDQEAAHLLCEYEQTMAEQKLEATQHVFLTKHAQKRKMMELQLPMQAAQSPVPLSSINSQRRNLPTADSQGSLLAPPGGMAYCSPTPSRNTPNTQANAGLATPQSLLALPSAGSSCSRSVSPSRLKPARLQPVLLPAISSPRNRSISPAPRQCITPMNQGGFCGGRPPMNRSFAPHVRSLTPPRTMPPTARGDVAVLEKSVNAQSANLASRRQNLLSPSTSRFRV